MALGGCYACIKYLMFAFNFIYWLSGCAILGVGIWLRVDENAAEFMNKSSKIDVIYTLSYVLMGIGFLIMIIGFLGCCGAVRESQCMLASFFILLFLIFATLLGFGIWAAVAKETFKDFTADMLKEGVANYNTDPGFMKSVQEYFDCCGWKKGAEDYSDAGYEADAPCENANRDKPCNAAFYSWIENKLVIIAGVTIGFSVKMILGMIFSMLLCCAVRDQVA
uniref:Tetraspanin n=1 Tax=Arion vulgaris TaxID=1028688 RepID=A0A0B7AY31_9EUPU